MRIRRASHYKKRQQVVAPYRVNERIFVPEVQVIDESGTVLGVLQTKAALALAQERGYDLVEVSPVAKPPVCKLLDWGSFKYRQDKKQQKSKLTVHKAETKGVRLSLGMKEHDMQVRIGQATRFLEKGNNVKIELVLRGREKEHRDRAREIIFAFVEEISNISVLDQSIQEQGGRMFAIIKPT